MFNADNYWITIAEVKGFTLVADEVFSIKEREALTDYLAMQPLAGDVIPDTDGVRLLRWPSSGKGKASSVRVIYFFRDLNMPVYLLALYQRGERLSVSTQEKAAIRELVADIVSSYAIRNRAYVTPPGAA
ncbi:hypothetical protein [Caulobacter segnis]